MTDNLSEVGKLLGKTKKNAEAALRRYQPNHPKIDRIRDVFDTTIPFEMEFETDQQDSIVNIDLYFNKPPPLSCIGRFNLICQEFILGGGDHLVQVVPYEVGSIFVFNVASILDASKYNEYDPSNGLVWIQSASNYTTVYNVCYTVDTDG